MNTLNRYHSDNLSTTSSLSNAQRSFIVLSLILVIVALWAPFGFSLIGLIEEWAFLASYHNHGIYFTSGLDNPQFFVFAIRPLWILPFSTAYFLDNNSFNYWHILLMLVLLLKGFSASYLLWKASGSRTWAFFAGILVILYPADTMQLSFRSLHISCALSLLLLASSFLVAAYNTQSKTKYYLFGLAAALTLLPALLMYEAGAFLIILPFAVLFVRNGFSATIKNIWKNKSLALFWGGSIVVYLAHTMYISSQVAYTYEKQLTGNNLFSILKFNYPKLFTIGAFRSLIGGWYDAVHIAIQEYSIYGYLYLLAITACIFLLFYFFNTRNKTSENRNAQTESSNSFIALRLIIVGFLLVLLGYFPYLCSTSHLSISQRTFLFATPGAVITWIGLLMLLACKLRTLSMLVLSVMVLSGLSEQLYQFKHYVNISTTQRNLLRNIVENFNGNVGDKTLLILDESNQLNRTWMFLNSNLSGALTYFYEHPMDHIQICHMPGNNWEIEGDPLAREGSCTETENAWIFNYPEKVSGPGYPQEEGKQPLELAKDKVITLRINADGTVDSNPQLANYRTNLHESKNNPAKRYRNILLSSSSLNAFNRIWANQKTDRYEWDFGTWWNLDIPIKGSGWRDADWHNLEKLKHWASAWKTQKNARLLFDMHPSKSTYVVRGKFDFISNQTIKDSFVLKINNHPVNYEWIGPQEFSAVISYSELHNGVNTVEFDSEVDKNYYGLSLNLAYISITPKPPGSVV